MIFRDLDMASGGQTKSKSGSHYVVAAMDFGTTYSGYAYSLTHEYESDPTKVFAHTKWVAGSQQLISLKTPSILLLNPDKSFKSFGYEAENDYGDLAAECNHKDYYYFRRFKMLLYNAEVSFYWYFTLVNLRLNLLIIGILSLMLSR